MPSLPVLGKHLRPPGDADSSAPAALGDPANSLTEAGRKLQRLWEELKKLQKAGLQKQAAAALLRAYAGPASQHSLRMEHATDAATQQYDDLLTSCWRDLLERDLDDAAVELLGLPARFGGLGAQLAGTRRHAAFLASWSAAAQEVTEDQGSGTLSDCLERLPRAAQQLETARRGLQGQGLELAPGGDLATALQTPLKQGLATEKMQRTLRAALLRRLPLHRQAELRGAAGSGSAAFLAYPQDELCSLENALWQAGARRRLQLPRAELSQQELATATAACCLRAANGAGCRGALDDGGYHALTCQLGGGVVARHGGLNRRVGGLLHRWRGERPLLEQQRVPTWDRQRPDGQLERAILDLQYQDDDGTRWLDVSVRHPAAGTQAELRVAARRDGEASRRGERDKHARYPGDRLTPFVLEAGGRLGAEGRLWLLGQVRRLPEDQQARELARAYKVLSCGLQAATARQLRKAAGLR